MPLQYPTNSPYNPYQEVKKPKNWPLIILITLGVIILISAGVYFYVNNSSFFKIGSPADDNIKDEIDDLFNNSNNSIAPGEPNPAACGEDLYNCGDFTKQIDAQAVYDVCIEQGAGDVHQLDNDGDGEVCESLPQ